MLKEELVQGSPEATRAELDSTTFATNAKSIPLKRTIVEDIESGSEPVLHLDEDEFDSGRQIPSVNEIANPTADQGERSWAEIDKDTLRRWRSTDNHSMYNPKSKQIRALAMSNTPLPAGIDFHFFQICRYTLEQLSALLSTMSMFRSEYRHIISTNDWIPGMEPELSWWSPNIPFRLVNTGKENHYRRFHAAEE